MSLGSYHQKSYIWNLILYMTLWITLMSYTSIAQCHFPWQLMTEVSKHRYRTKEMILVFWILRQESRCLFSRHRYCLLSGI